MGVKRNLLAWVLVLLHGAALPQAAVVPSPAALTDTIYDRASEAVFWADWDELERLYEAAQSDLNRGDEGRLLASCRFGFGVGKQSSDESQAYHDARLASSLDWARRKPESPLAHVVHLQAMANQAWFIRGGGFAKTVSEQRFADFRAKQKEALAYVQAHAAVMGRDNYYIRPLLILMRGVGVGVEKQLEVVRTGLRKDATDECLYQAAIDSLVPKWGGEPEQLESWIRESMKGLSETDALKRYTRLYNTATHSDYEQSLFETSYARWPLMRDGLRALISESPKSRYWKGRLAYFVGPAKHPEPA